MNRTRLYVVAGIVVALLTYVGTSQAARPFSAGSLHGTCRLYALLNAQGLTVYSSSIEPLLKTAASMGAILPQKEKPPMTLTARHALVTGGSRGIGRGIALKLADHGIHIAINYLKDEASAKATLEQVTRAVAGF